MVENDSVPHAILMTGPSGCGKTTLARILQRKLKADKRDRITINANRVKGIDMVREISATIGMAPFGETRVYIIDEAHKLTSDAQGAFLDLLEDGIPDFAYIILCTTDPQKLLKTIRTRCTEISIKPLEPGHLNILLKETADKESLNIPKSVIKKIIENCEGSARKAMVLLNQVSHLNTEAEMLDVISRSTYEQDAINICRTLFKPRVRWSEMVTVLKECNLEDAEGIRWLILAYAKKVLQSGNPKAFTVLQSFRDNFYDCKDAGLWAACYEVIGLK
jgi:DNA polymerase III gamma/tau subunit